jgi:hypothetical protein
VCLLDESEKVLLKVQQDTEEAVVEIDCEHKIPTQGYANYVLEEMLEDRASIEDLADLAAAVACNLSAHLIDEPLVPTKSATGGRPSASAQLRRFQHVLRASELILGRDNIHGRVLEYVTAMKGQPAVMMPLPPRFWQSTQSGALPSQSLIQPGSTARENNPSLLRIKAIEIAIVILAFGNVGDLEACRTLTLGEITTIATCNLLSDLIAWDGRSPVTGAGAFIWTHLETLIH